MSVTIRGGDDLRARANTLIGSTEWEEMTFARIQAFADATGDQQWIHVDRARIAAESPFGAPIAHGYFTLSLVAGRFFDLIDLQGMAMVINYGTNKVRFPNPLKEGNRFRLTINLGAVEEKDGGWLEALFLASVDIEGAKKPACVAECVYRFKPEE